MRSGIKILVGAGGGEQRTYVFKQWSDKRELGRLSGSDGQPGMHLGPHPLIIYVV